MTDFSKMIGVVIVTYNSSDVITDCLDSLSRSEHQGLRILVCDNASSDDTIERVRAWGAQAGLTISEYGPEQAADLSFSDLGTVTVLRTGGNLGYAGGVNAGLRVLRACPEVDLFWVLNPDAEVEPGTAGAFLRQVAENGRFGLMGGRIQYKEPVGLIQSDGGTIGRWTGVVRNINRGTRAEEAPTPATEALDYIAGANILASREFVDRVGLMQEDYFLYYEEIDWAFRRGDLPLAYAPGAVIHHIGGSAIGSSTIQRRASAFSNYFNYRSRMKFVGRFYPLSLPSAYIYGMLKVAQLLLLGAGGEAYAAFCGIHQLPPPKKIAQRISSAGS